MKRKKGVSYWSLLLKNMRSHYWLYLFLVPALTIIILFNYLPIYGVQIAFKDFVPSRGISGSEWVGFDHFIRFIDSYHFGNLMRNTFTLAIATILITFPFPIILALVINTLREGMFKKSVQFFSYMPHFISTIVVVGMLTLFLSPRSGIINYLIEMLGGERLQFMAKEEWFVPLYVISEIWQHTGWESIIFVATLAGIDPSLYEAARIDGASRWAMIRRIDLPMLTPTMMIIFILKTGYIIASGGATMSPGFEKVYLMQNDLNIGVSEVISTYVYKIGLQSQQFSYSAAIGLFNTVIGFAIVLVLNEVFKRTNDAGLW